MTYKLNTQGGVIFGDVFIPEDEGNRDYRTYLQWVAAGNTPQPADVPSTLVTLTPSHQIILADGVDKAHVVVNGAPNGSAEITINAVPQTINFDGTGSYALEMSCDTPNTTLLVQAGLARAVIYAVEVPS
jgi:hypothetical protein